MICTLLGRPCTVEYRDVGCSYIRPGMSSLCANLILSTPVWCSGLERPAVKRVVGGSNPPIDTSTHNAHLIK